MSKKNIHIYESNKMTIGLIDNFPIALRGMSVLLGVHFPGVRLTTAIRVSEFGQLSHTFHADLIILGVNDNRLFEYVSCIKECRKAFPFVPLIVCCEKYILGMSSTYFQEGVRGHLLKQCGEEEILECIRAVLQGKLFLSAALHQLSLQGHEGLKPLRLEVFANSGLNRREQEVASYLIQGEKTSTIAILLHKSRRTVTAIKRDILRKLNIVNVVELLRIFNNPSQIR
ncbi:response regulator transcription factor [Dyadobacter aurulentus]|uniref:response regulator transcription factor n=1 Tax=Dyadobacter sp. UC 10 TaxID=2605428 RepID=UPI001788D92D|nr:response regulator transcription factor [Dyadobacter sp. UC 10]